MKHFVSNLPIATGEQPRADFFNPRLHAFLQFLTGRVLVFCAPVAY